MPEFPTAGGVVVTPVQPEPGVRTWVGPKRTVSPEPSLSGESVNGLIITSIKLSKSPPREFWFSGVTITFPVTGKTCSS